MAQDPVRQRRKLCFASNVRLLIRTGSTPAAQLAESLGIPDRTIWRWQEEGAAHPDKRTRIRLQQFCDHFGVTVDDLWDRDLPEKVNQRCTDADHLAERVRVIFNQSKFEIKGHLATLIHLNYFLFEQHRLKLLIEQDNMRAEEYERDAEKFRKEFQDEKMNMYFRFAKPFRKSADDRKADLAVVEAEVRKLMAEMKEVTAREIDTAQ
ncbi:MAG: hypothetical protein CME33_19720 [Gimesia sp.]|uniref:hypothetical protein n=1 Tax=Gimesia sp. TaxID=2024833 RepID=UPI000C567A44|nr:hypothetical protein [Gimesia sp.]MAX38792.1 hypothetical protein [Gimesia sp.]|tara:strand:- start:7792 stop:8415 length:624 start_codon:yes stop_codon:yes gene_type:complete